MIKLNKNILLILAVFMMLVLIPTAFASGIDDAGVVGVNNQSTTDRISAIPDEIAVESVSQSEVDEELSVSDESEVLEDYVYVGLTTTPTPDTVENYDGSSKQINVVLTTNSMTNCPEDLQYYSGGVYVFIDHDDGNAAQAIKIMSGSLNNYQQVYNVQVTFDLSTIYNNLTTGTNILTFGVQESFFNGKRYTYQYNPLTVVVGPGGQSNPDVIYVDDFDGATGGTGSENFPYHSLKKVLTDAENVGKQIMLLPGTYAFTENINLYDRDFTLTAIGEVNFTSTRALFNKNPLGDVTFNGINFVNIASSTSAVIYSPSTYINGIGTINFNNCSFIANTAANLIESSCNVNIKGCTFIGNEATSTSIQDGGLIENHFTDLSTIDISYSIFINNEIAEVKDVSNNVYGNPIIVDANNGEGPIVKFNYNFVDDNDELTNAEISNNARITSNGYTKITPTVQNMDVGDTQDIIINFTKNNGGALEDYMPDLNVTLAPTVNFNSIPITITKNGGKGEYEAVMPANPESVDVKVGNYVINNFTFIVTGESNLKDPNLVVNDFLAVNVTLNGTISVSRDGNGAISFVSDDESIAIVDDTGKVTGVSEGNTTITVYVDTDGEYAPDIKKVNVTVSLLNPNLTVSSESLTMDEKEEAYITINRLGNGAISFESDDESIAEAYNFGSSYAIWGKSSGNTIITVNVAANGNYAAASKKICFFIMF